jgi:predicted kinase
MARFDLDHAVAQVETRLDYADASSAQPFLLMLSGLPGTGKSSLARQLSERLRSPIVETDVVRKTLFARPAYSADESAVVHWVSRLLIKKLLSRGVPVIFDATNLVESQRGTLYHTAEQVGVKLVIVRVVAPPQVVYERLQRRQRARESEDISDATWDVYRRMAERQQPIRRPHLVVDTNEDLQPALAKIIREVTR